MRLIDADKLTTRFDVVLEGMGAIKTVIQNTIESAPTVDQWHYPSKGEYPPKGRQILAYAWNVHNVLAKYDTFDGKNRFVTFDAYNGFIEIKNVIRWQYIVSPKEES